MMAPEFQKRDVLRSFFGLCFVLVSFHSFAAEVPLHRYVCPDESESYFLYDGITADASDGFCGQDRREIKITPISGSDLGQIDYAYPIDFDSRHSRALIHIKWYPGKTGTMSFEVSYRKRIYDKWLSCKWTGKRYMYTYYIHREFVHPGTKLSGKTVGTAASDETTKEFVFSYYPSENLFTREQGCNRRLNSTDVDACGIRAVEISYKDSDGSDRVVPIVRTDGKYLPTKITYHTKGRGPFSFTPKVLVQINGSCDRKLDLAPVTITVYSSCYQDDLSNVHINLRAVGLPEGTGYTYHSEDGTYSINKNQAYQLLVTGIQDFNSHYHWSTGNSSGEDITFTNNNTFQVSRDIGSYSIDLLPNDVACPSPDPVVVLLGGENINIYDKCTITLPEYLSKTDYELDANDITLQHFAAYVKSDRSIIVKPGVSLELGAELFIDPEAPQVDTEDPDRMINFTEQTAFDEYGRIIATGRSYFDDRGLPLQSQTKNLSANVVMATATLYDALGRAAISTLPAPVRTVATGSCFNDDQVGSNISFGYKEDFVKAEDGSIYNYTHFDLTNENNPLPLDASTEGTLGWYYGSNNGESEAAAMNEPLVATTLYPYSRTLFKHDGTGSVKGVTSPGNQFKAGSVYLATSEQLPVLTDDPYFNTDFNSYLTIRERELGLSRPLSIEGEFFKTASVDEVGKKAVSYTDKSGKTIISLYYGTQADPITKSYQFYDLAGRLLVSISPNGLEQYKVIQSTPEYITNFGDIDKTRYFYNSKGLLTKTEEKIAGQAENGISTTEFIYRGDGRIRFSQNAEQLKANKFSYTNYDKVGRPVESGEFQPTGSQYAFHSFDLQRILEADSKGGIPDEAGVKSERIFTRYDEPDADIPLGRTQRFVHGAVSKTEKVGNIRTWYSYDERGRLEWMIQDIDGLGVKTIDYRYGPTGNVQEVLYQKGSEDEQFTHFYEYDLDGRLHKVYTTRELLEYDKLGNLVNDGAIDPTTGKIANPGILEHQATYYYYLHGPLKRIELATQVENSKKVSLQGIDFTYTVQGALKSINHADKTKDPGKDDINTVADGITKTTAHADVFGMTLDYFSGDYINAMDEAELITIPGFEDQYSGLIKAQRWHGPIELDDELAYAYQYDDRNEFTKATWGTIAGNTFTTGVLNYQEAIVSDVVGGVARPPYDANGNINHLKRYSGKGVSIANFQYNYKPNTNILTSITQNNQPFRLYTYNDLGQMVGEVEGSKTKYIEYDVTGKVKAIYSDNAHLHPTVRFEYDEKGFRLSKTAYDENYQPSYRTWYVQDASGNVAGTYEENIESGLPPKATELPVYGSGRLGLYKPDYGITFYEISDHLGNVRAVIGDEIETEYLATMESEPDRHDKEVADFVGIVSTPVSPALYINHTQSQINEDGSLYAISDPNEVIRLNNHPLDMNARSVGAGKMLHVNAGDAIHAEVYVKYNNFTSNSNNAAAGLVSALTNTFGDVVIVDGSSIFNVMTTPAFAAMPAWSRYKETDPRAFLTYLLFDKDNNLVDFDFDQVSNSAQIIPAYPGKPHEQLVLDINIRKEGFLYIYISNESDQNMDMYFDDLRIKHTYSNIVAGGDFYPYGLTIDDRQINREDYRYGYQGKYAEKDDETGWSHFELREYDATIGRWTAVDPKRQFFSPYVGMGNNPVSGTDPDGGGVLTDFVNESNGQTLHIEDGNNQVLFVNNDDFQRLSSMASAPTWNMSDCDFYLGILDNSNRLNWNTDLGRIIRTVYAEMSGVGSTSDVDRQVVAESIVNRYDSKLYGGTYDDILTPSQYNAIGKPAYNDPYGYMSSIKSTAPSFYSAHKDRIMGNFLNSISVSYRAYLGKGTSLSSKPFSYVSPPLSSTYFDGDRYLKNVTNSITGLKGISGVWTRK